MVVTKTQIISDALQRNVDLSMIKRFEALQQNEYTEIPVPLDTVLFLVKSTIDLSHAKNIAESYTKENTKQHLGFIFIDRKRNKVWDGNHRLYAYYLSKKEIVPIIELQE